MDSPSRTDRWRSSTTLLPLLLLLVGGVGWLACDWEDAGEPAATATPDARSASAPATPAVLAAHDRSTPGEAAVAEPTRASAPLPPIRCVVASTRTPLPDVHLFRDGEIVDGPSDVTGTLADLTISDLV